MQIYRTIKTKGPDCTPVGKTLTEVALATLDKRAQAINDPIFLFSLLFNPQYRNIAISGKYGIESFQEMLGQLQYAIDNSRCMEECVAVIKELSIYLKCDSPYDQMEKDPIKFWAKNDTELGKLANRVVNVIPHSAGVERLFSRITYAKNKAQNRMSKQTLTNAIKVKMFLRKSSAIKKK